MNTNKALTQNEHSTNTMFTGSHESNEQNMEALQNRQRKQIRCHVIYCLSPMREETLMTPKKWSMIVAISAQELVDGCRNKC